MKIIDLGICVNNIDPKGIGRIRCKRYDAFVSEKEKAVDYVEWGDTDPFVAQPFLPTNLNLIPRVGQAVKIINYNTEKSTVNQEYIAGPFTTMYDFNSQTWSQQIENTTYGVVIKHKDDIREVTGRYKKPNTENNFAKDDDFAIYGRAGSDILFTENGLQLRGGKLESRDRLKPSQKEESINFPIVAKKSPTLYLKKYSKKATIKSIETKKITTDSSNLKTVVEYEIQSLSGNQNIKFYVYNIKVSTPTFKTNSFNEFTKLSSNNAVLINTENDTTSPTFIISGVSITDVATVVRTTISKLHTTNLHQFNKTYPTTDLHPFFYRPTTLLKNLNPSNSTENTNKLNISQKVRLTKNGPFSSGLVYSKLNISPTSKENKENKNVFVVDDNSPEQTFAAIKSDKIYFLSTDTNETNLTIDFDALDKYELTQEDYVRKIEPNTFSIVRGENLVKILRSIIEVLFSHRHNINKSISSQPGYREGNELLRLVQTLENDILNKSIKIN